MLSNLSCCPHATPSQGHTHTRTHAVWHPKGTDRLAQCPVRPSKVPLWNCLASHTKINSPAFHHVGAQHTHTRTHRRTRSVIRESAGSQGWISCFSEGEVISKRLRAIKVLLVCLIFRRIIVFLWMLMLSNFGQWGIGITHTVLMDVFQSYLDPWQLYSGQNIY